MCLLLEELVGFISNQYQCMVCVCLYCVTRFGNIRLIAGWVKIDFLPEKASTKFDYCLCKI